jgi:hypothetical protein
MDQSTNTVVMIRPFFFGRNEQTAVNNYFQQIDSLGFGDSSAAAVHEFDVLVEKLKQKGVRVVVWQDNASPFTPDSIFPNNWVSFHEDGTVMLYPMFAENRRLERMGDVDRRISEEGFQVSQIIDISDLENSGKFLEGTGSLVLDRVNKIAYAALSERTNAEVLDTWAQKSGYEVVKFHAFHSVDGKRLPVSHTNVIMSICTDLAVICLDSIDDLNERNEVFSSLRRFRNVVLITEEQVNQFAGNMLELRNSTGERFLILSERAYKSLEPGQLAVLGERMELVYSSLETIENLGGGSARCMIAEVFLTSK